MFRFLYLAVLVLVGIEPSESNGRYLRSLQLTAEDDSSAKNPSFGSTIPLILALDFLDNATATRLESASSEDVLVDSFCYSVQQQAGGNQVKLAAVEVGITIATRNDTLDCKVIDSVRTYNSNAPDNELFTLEVELTQVVYASSDNITILIPIVATGFNRGNGGRVRFRTLLQETQASFSSISDIRVLQELSPPQLPPTVSPSLSPSLSIAPSMKIPSLVPSSPPSSTPTTLVPTTSFPSLEPTSNPPSIKRSNEPSSFPSLTPSSDTISPTQAPSTLFPSNRAATDFPSNQATKLTDTPSMPEELDFATLEPSESLEFISEIISDVTVEPSFYPSFLPSFPPSRSTTTLPTTGNNDMASVISQSAIAAIIGGVLAVLLLCCCCMYSSFCKNRKRPERIFEELGDDRGRNSQANNAVTNGLSSLPVVPEIVQLDEDHMSLANTTLGEHTAGRKPPKKKRFVLESFDESSLYTSTGLKAIMPSRDISDNDSINDPVNIAHLNLEKIAAKSRITSPKNETDPARIGVSIEYEDSLFFEENEEEGLLGAKGLHSPLAEKIEDMVNGELGTPSNASSNSSLGLPMSPEVESPLTMIGQQENVIIARDDYSSETTRSEHVDSRSSSSSDSHSSFTNKIGNVKVQTNASTIGEIEEPLASFVSDSTFHSNESPGSAQSHEIQDAPGNYSFALSAKKKEPTDPVGMTSPTICSGGIPDSAEPDHFVPVTPTKSCSDRGAGSTDIFEDGSITSSFSSNISGDASGTENLMEQPRETRRKLADALDAATADLRVGLGAKSGSSTETPDGSMGVPPPPSVNHITTNSTATTPVTSNIAEGIPGYVSNSVDLCDYPQSNLIESPKSRGSKDAVVESPVSAKSMTLSPQTRSPASLKTVEPSNQRNKTRRGDNMPASPHGTIESDDWLLSTIEGTLGPRSASADLESLAGKSLDGGSSNMRSANKAQKKRRNSMGAGTLSSSMGEEKSGDAESFITPRTLEHDLHRLELQLAMLKTEVSRTKNATGVSSISSSVANKTRMSTKQRVVVVAPPGKLGVVLANRKDGYGTVISDIRPSSALCGLLLPGDKLVAVNGQDVTGMVVGDITEIMKKNANQERRLTVITSSSSKNNTNNKKSESKSSSP